MPRGAICGPARSAPCWSSSSPDSFRPTRLRAREHPREGRHGQINLSLDALPFFPGRRSTHSALRGRIHVGPNVDYLERAFDAASTRVVARPWLEIAVPSTHDASLAPAGKHVMSIYAQYAPRTLRKGTWSDERDVLLKNVLRVLESVSPGLERIVVHAEVITPEDLEVQYGMDGGHIHQRRTCARSDADARPVLGMSDYSSPIRGSIWGPRLASRRRHHGAPGLLAGSMSVPSSSGAPPRRSGRSELRSRASALR